MATEAIMASFSAKGTTQFAERATTTAEAEYFLARHILAVACIDGRQLAGLGMHMFRGKTSVYI